MGLLQFLLVSCFVWYSVAEVYVAVHSVDGFNFIPSGKISPIDDSKAKEDFVVLSRPALTATQKKDLERLAAADGYYTIRVYAKGQEDSYVAASTKAKCLMAASNSTEYIKLHFDEDGILLAMTYVNTGCGSVGHVQATADDIVLPPQVYVYFDFPYSAPTIINSQERDYAGTADAPFFELEQPPGKDSAGSTDDKRKQPPPPKDDRTWLQKNWMFAIGIGMVVFNMIVSIFNQQAQPAAPAQGAARQAGQAARQARR